MKRLPNNFGSVHRLSGNRRKPYAVRVKDEKANYKYLGYYATYKEALEALTAYNQNPYDLDLSKSTVATLWEIFKQSVFA